MVGAVHGKSHRRLMNQREATRTSGDSFYVPSQAREGCLGRTAAAKALAEAVSAEGHHSWRQRTQYKSGYNGRPPRVMTEAMPQRGQWERRFVTRRQTVSAAALRRSIRAMNVTEDIAVIERRTRDSGKTGTSTRRSPCPLRPIAA